jgi:hypothetical protein
MDEVIKMYAMNDGDSNLEPAELSADHDELEEDERLKPQACSPPPTTTILLSKRA